MDMLEIDMLNSVFDFTIACRTGDPWEGGMIPCPNIESGRVILNLRTNQLNGDQIQGTIGENKDPLIFQWIRQGSGPTWIRPYLDQAGIRQGSAATWIRPYLDQVVDHGDQVVDMEGLLQEPDQAGDRGHPPGPGGIRKFHGDPAKP